VLEGAVAVIIDDEVHVDRTSHLEARGKLLICGKACGDEFLSQGLSRVRWRDFIWEF